MSIIEKSNPLNLQYQVCIVAGCSTELGTIICKTLLKANALVFGVDARPKDESLNAGVGMHFQFEQCNLSDAGSTERILDAAREAYRLERIDVLVNIVEEGTSSEMAGLKSLSHAVGQVMARERKGCIVNVVGSVDSRGDYEAIDFAREISKAHKGIRCNVIVPSEAATNGEDHQSVKTYDQAKSHMTEIMNQTTNEGPKQVTTESKLYDIGNLTLFLAGDMSERISGSVVHLDASCEPF